MAVAAEVETSRRGRPESHVMEAPPEEAATDREIAVAWRDQWSTRPQVSFVSDEGAAVSALLSYEENEELRHLNYLAQIGTLAGPKAQRLIELRLRDRRLQIRPPEGGTEEGQREVAEKASPRFLGRRRR